MEVNVELYAPAALSLDKVFATPVGPETWWAPDTVWACGDENVLPQPGIEPKFVCLPSFS
jgi:hypothetical protein